MGRKLGKDDGRGAAVGSGQRLRLSIVLAMVGLMHAMGSAQEAPPPEVLSPTLRSDRQLSFLSGFRLLTAGGLTASAAANDVAVNRQGFIYVVGSTNDTKFPATANAYQRTYGSAGDGYVFKLDPTGHTLLAATYFGGPQGESFRRVVIDSQGNVIVVGEIHGPLLQADGSYTDGERFIVRFDSELSRVISRTTWPAWVADVALDSQDRLYVTGSGAANVSVFAPVAVGYDPPCPRSWSCRYVARFTADGARVEVAARVPAGVVKLRAASGGGLWVTGYAEPDWSELQPDRRDNRFPKPNRWFKDLFIGRFSEDLTEITAQAVLPEFRTWGLNSGLADISIASWDLDTFGNLYLAGTGHQRGTHLLPITSSAVQRRHAESPWWYAGDAYLMVIRPSGELQYSTWIGSAREERGTRVMVDASGIAWVFGIQWRTSEAAAPCATWAVGIDPRKKGSGSLRYTGCATHDFGGTWEYTGKVVAGADGSVMLAATASASTVHDLTRNHGTRVYRLDPAPPARIKVHTTTPNPVRFFDAWAFEATLENSGDAAAVNTKLAVKLPLDKFRFVRVETAQGWCAYEEQVNCELGTLGPQSSVRVRVFVEATGSSRQSIWLPWIGDFETQASWQDTTGQHTTGQEAGSARYHWARHFPPRAFAELGDLELTVEGYKPVVQKGERVRYFVTVRNLGPDDATRVWMRTNYGYVYDYGITPTNPCYAGQCLFLKIKAGEQVRVEIDWLHDSQAERGIFFNVWRSGHWPLYSGEPNESNNSVWLPIDVVTGESRFATVLERYKLYAQVPSLYLYGKNIYATSTAYWDGEPRQTSSDSYETYVNLLESDVRPGKHTVRLCSLVAECSNTLEVMIEAPKPDPKVVPRMSMRMERGITSTPYAGPRRFVRPVDETEERRKKSPGMKDP